MSYEFPSGVLRIESELLETVEERPDSHSPESGIERPAAWSAGARRQEIDLDRCWPADYFRTKGAFDRAAGIILLIVATPVIACLMALVRLTSPGPAIYRQRRVGKDGKDFTLFKLRTMYQGAEQLTGPVWAQKRDSRVTTLGKVFRHLHLDELPQLWNVARGDMDLVGPRPERPHFVSRFTKDIPAYALRHLVRPGITGLAQINLPPDETIECVRRKLILDTEYVTSARFSMDLRILVCTALRMCGLRHGRAVRLLGLERTVPRQPISMHETNCNPRMHDTEGAEPSVAPAHSRPKRDPSAARIEGHGIQDSPGGRSSLLPSRRQK